MNSSTPTRSMVPSSAWHSCAPRWATSLPDAVFVQAPVEQFINETLSGRRNGFLLWCLIDAARCAHCSRARCSSFPRRSPTHGPTGAWMSIRPQDPAGLHEPAWNFDPQWEDVRGTRSSAWAVALLVAQHVWRDAEFLANVMEQLELIPELIEASCSLLPELFSPVYVVATGTYRGVYST